MELRAGLRVRVRVRVGRVEEAVAIYGMHMSSHMSSPKRHMPKNCLKKMTKIYDFELERMSTWMWD